MVVGENHLVLIRVAIRPIHFSRPWAGLARGRGGAGRPTGAGQRKIDLVTGRDTVTRRVCVMVVLRKDDGSQVVLLLSVAQGD